MSELLIIECDRLTYGPPQAEANAAATESLPGTRFVILRRGGGLLRFDASEWIVHGELAQPRNLHETVGHHPCLNRVGFGLTRRGALRSMRRDAEHAL